MTIYSLDVLLFLFGPICCSMSSSNCCFLTCIQISQEAGQVVCYSLLLQNFPQFIVIHTVKGFGIVNKAEVDVFLELSCFFYAQQMLAIWSLVSLPFLKPACISQIKLPTSFGSSKEQESSRKTSISALLTMPKALTLWITINCGKFWKTWE